MLQYFVDFILAFCLHSHRWINYWAWWATPKRLANLQGPLKTYKFSLCIVLLICKLLCCKLAPLKSSIIWSGFCILTLRSALIRYLRHLQMSTNITTRMLLTAMLLMSCLSYLSLLMVTTIHRMIQIINHTLMDISKSFNLQRVSVLLSCCLFFASLHRSLLCFYCCPCLSWLQGPIQGLHMKTWILF